MRTIDEIKYISGKFELQLTLENCQSHTILTSNTLYDIVKYGNGLTFANCMNECNHTEADVAGHSHYTVEVMMVEDRYSNACQTGDIDGVTVWIKQADKF